MTTSDHEDAAAMYERAADELSKAVEHLRTSARHMRERQVPRACAHAVAARGHVENHEDAVIAAAKLHASKAGL